MKTVVALLALGALVAATYVYAAVVRTPEAPPPAPAPAFHDPVEECLRAWHCAGPVDIHEMTTGELYGEYICDPGILFLKERGPVL